MDAALVVQRRFRGPAHSGNGGWTSGALAELTDRDGGPVRVRLAAPPPLDTPLSVRRDGDTVVAEHEGRRVLTAERVDEPLEPVPAVPHAAALGAGPRYAGGRGHPFPECFACGPDRQAGDGLRLRPGPVEPPVPGVDVAAAWTPDDVSVPVIWAALDCPGGWSVDIVGRPMVLGTMTARVLARPLPGQPCVVTGRAVEVGERKTRTATSLYGPAGELLAVAAHVWVAVDPATFGRSV